MPLHIQGQGCLSHLAPLTLRGTLEWGLVPTKICKLSIMNSRGTGEVAQFDTTTARFITEFLNMSVFSSRQIRSLWMLVTIADRPRTWQRRNHRNSDTRAPSRNQLHSAQQVARKKQVSAKHINVSSA